MQNRFDKVPANYMYNILVLDGGTQGLIIVKSLRKLGNRVVMIYHGKHSYADDSKYVSKKYFCLCAVSGTELLPASIVWTHKLWRSKRQSSIFHAGEKETLLFSSADFMLKIMRLNLFMNVVSFSGSH